MNPTVIRIRNVGRRLGGKAVWIDSVDIPRGKVVAIMGVSGAGKSTLLHVIGGLARPDFNQDTNVTGEPTQKPVLEVVFSSKGKELIYDLCKGSPRRFQERISFVFQSPYLLQSATASANIALGAYAAGRSISPQAMEQITHQLGLDRSFLGDRSGARSGGERQRIAVGRAFARRPNLILADEPTANLDPTLAEEVIGLLVQWASSAGDRTTVWVTHDVRLAAKFCDAIVVLSKGRLAEWSAWPRANPRDPAIIRGWLDGDFSVGNSGTGCRAISVETREVAPLKTVQAECLVLPVALATKWQRLRFWMKIGIAQVLDGLGADRIRPLRRWTSIALPHGSDPASARVVSCKERVVECYQLLRSFSPKAAVFQLTLFLMLMIALWAKLDGLARTIRDALLTPTMNPVIVSSRATIDDPAVNEAKALLAIRRGNGVDVPDAFGRYELNQRRISGLREGAGSVLLPEACSNPKDRVDREILMDIVALDPNEPMLNRVPVLAPPGLPKDRLGISDRFDGLWSVWISRAAQEKISQLLDVKSTARTVCLEVRGIWLTGEVTGVLQENARGRFGPYDLIISGTQWRDFGPARDRDYYQSAAIYFDAEPKRSRELVKAVRLRASEIFEAPNTRLIQSLANDAAFERISAALERNVLLQIIVGFLGSLSIIMLVLVVYAYVSANLRNNVKPICVAVALGAGFLEIAVVQVARILLIATPAAILSGGAMTCLTLYGWSSSRHLISQFWAGIPIFIIGIVLLTLGISKWWFSHLTRRSLADQLKELE